MAGLSGVRTSTEISTVCPGRASGTRTSSCDQQCCAPMSGSIRRSLRPVQGTLPSLRTFQIFVRAAARGCTEQSDGHFGTSTVQAYSAWQQSLGFTGIDANGLPGKTSLNALGEGRFTLGNEIVVGPKVTVDGKTVNQRTADMLATAEGRAWWDLKLTQGSYNTGVDASAGTHDGGGAIDISVDGMTAENRTNVVRALREVGFAAWERTPAQGFEPHIHAVAVSDTDLSTAARQQVGDYYEGRNGLASGAADDGPQVPKVTWEQYRG